MNQVSTLFRVAPERAAENASRTVDDAARLKRVNGSERKPQYKCYRTRSCKIFTRSHGGCWAMLSGKFLPVYTVRAIIPSRRAVRW